MIDKWRRRRKNSRGIISLSVTNLPDRRFFSNSPARMHNSAQIDTPLSSRARMLWQSFFLRLIYAQPLCLPFSLLRHLWHVSLNPDLFAFFKYWKGGWKEHQSSDRHIQVPTHHFWGCVGVFYEIMPQFHPPTGSKGSMSSASSNCWYNSS